MTAAEYRALYANKPAKPPRQKPSGQVGKPTGERLVKVVERVGVVTVTHIIPERNTELIAQLQDRPSGPDTTGEETGYEGPDEI